MAQIIQGGFYGPTEAELLANRSANRGGRANTAASVANVGLQYGRNQALDKQAKRTSLETTILDPLIKQWGGAAMAVRQQPEPFKEYAKLLGMSPEETDVWIESIATGRNTVSEMQQLGGSYFGGGDSSYAEVDMGTKVQEAEASGNIDVLTDLHDQLMDTLPDTPEEQLQSVQTDISYLKNAIQRLETAVPAPMSTPAPAPAPTVSANPPAQPMQYNLPPSVGLPPPTMPNLNTNLNTGIMKPPQQFAGGRSPVTTGDNTSSLPGMELYDAANPADKHELASVGKGEAIINSEATKVFGPVLDAMNQAVPNPYAPLAPDSTQLSGQQVNNNFAGIVPLIASLASSVLGGSEEEPEDPLYQPLGQQALGMQPAMSDGGGSSNSGALGLGTTALSLFGGGSGGGVSSTPSYYNDPYTAGGSMAFAGGRIPSYAEGKPARTTPSGASRSATTGVDYVADNAMINQPLNDIDKALARANANTATTGYSYTQAKTAMGLNPEMPNYARRSSAIDQLDQIYKGGQRLNAEGLIDVARTSGLDPNLVSQRIGDLPNLSQDAMASRFMREGMSENVARGRSARIYQEAKDLAARYLPKMNIDPKIVKGAGAIAGVAAPAMKLFAEAAGPLGDAAEFVTGTPASAPWGLASGELPPAMANQTLDQALRANAERMNLANTLQPQTQPPTQRTQYDVQGRPVANQPFMNFAANPVPYGHGMPAGSTPTRAGGFVPVPNYAPGSVPGQTFPPTVAVSPFGMPAGTAVSNQPPVQPAQPSNTPQPQYGYSAGPAPTPEDYAQKAMAGEIRVRDIPEHIKAEAVAIMRQQGLGPAGAAIARTGRQVGDYMAAETRDQMMEGAMNPDIQADLAQRFIDAGIEIDPASGTAVGGPAEEAERQAIERAFLDSRGIEDPSPSVRLNPVSTPGRGTNVTGREQELTRSEEGNRNILADDYDPTVHGESLETYRRGGRKYVEVAPSEAHTEEAPVTETQPGTETAGGSVVYDTPVPAGNPVRAAKARRWIASHKKDWTGETQGPQVEAFMNNFFPDGNVSLMDFMSNPVDVANVKLRRAELEESTRQFDEDLKYKKGLTVPTGGAISFFDANPEVWKEVLEVRSETDRLREKIASENKLDLYSPEVDNLLGKYLEESGKIESVNQMNAVYANALGIPAIAVLTKKYAEPGGIVRAGNWFGNLFRKEENEKSLEDWSLARPEGYETTVLTPQDALDRARQEADEAVAEIRNGG